MIQEQSKEYWEKRLSVDYSLGGVGFLSAGKGYNGWLYKMRKWHFKKILQRFNTSPAARCLDIGSGTGFYVQQLQEMGFLNITASDFTDMAVNNLRKKYPAIDVWNLDISGEGLLPARTFQMVTCMDVLFHIIDEQAYNNAIRNLSLFLEPGGILVITENLTSASKHRGHICERRREDILNNIRKNNLEIIHTCSQFIFLNPPMQSQSRLLWKISNIRVKLLRRASTLKSDRLGWLLGAIIFYIDVLLLRLGCKGRGTSIIVCRK